LNRLLANSSKVVPEEGSGSSRLLFCYVYFLGGKTLLNQSTSRLAPVVKHCKGFGAGLRESLERRFSFILRDVNYVMGMFIAHIFLIVFHIFFHVSEFHGFNF
jgi:hypothetical protein